MIGIQLQGHGHTNDIDLPLLYEAIAGDVVALLQKLNITNADFCFYNIGGGVAVQLIDTCP